MMALKSPSVKVTVVDINEKRQVCCLTLLSRSLMGYNSVLQAICATAVASLPRAQIVSGPLLPRHTARRSLVPQRPCPSRLPSWHKLLHHCCFTAAPARCHGCKAMLECLHGVFSHAESWRPLTFLPLCRIAAWMSDKLPIYEPGLGEVVKACRGRNLFFSTDVHKHVGEADIIFVRCHTRCPTAVPNS